jgi:hypothetical protein
MSPVGYPITHLESTTYAAQRCNGPIVLFDLFVVQNGYSCYNLGKHAITPTRWLSAARIGLDQVTIED